MNEALAMKLNHKNEALNWKSKFYLYLKIREFQDNNNIKVKCDIKKLCREKGWHLCPYNKENFNELYSISEDGFSVYQNNEFYIFYNPNMNKNRINFTIAHEVGHIFLLHHFYVNSDVLMYGGKGIWEDHANLFAQNILMPNQITEELKTKYNVETLAKFFGVSYQMVTTRINKLYADNLWFRKIE